MAAVTVVQATTIYRNGAFIASPVKEHPVIASLTWPENGQQAEIKTTGGEVIPATLTNTSGWSVSLTPTKPLGAIQSIGFEHSFNPIGTGDLSILSSN